MKKTKEQIANEQVFYFNKVKDYVGMEYGEELSEKISLAKYVNVSYSYVKNCWSLKKSIPYTAYGLVKFLKNTK